MNFSLTDLCVALPEVFLLVAACFILLIDAFVGVRYRFVTYLLVQLSLMITFILVIFQFGKYPTPLIIFSGGYILDKLALFAKLVIYLFSFFAFIYAREYIQLRNIAKSEYYLLSLLAVLGMSIMASAYNFLTIYLGLELLSLGLYSIIAMHKESNFAIEAAMKYFVLGGLASGLLLYGISIIYGITGGIRLDLIANVLQSQPNVVAIVGLIFVLAGLIFKFGAVPFHM